MRALLSPLRRRSPWGALALGASALSVASCAPPGIKGEVMMVVVTDMSLPKDIDKVRIEVVAQGAPLYKQDFIKLGGPDAEIKLPGTLAVLVDDQAPSTPVTLRVVAWQGAVPRVLQEIVTTVPLTEQVALRMPVQWLCDGSALPSLDEDGLPDATSTCAAGETCIAGTCTANTVSSATLPAFSAKNVFGGGTGDGDGSCFDTAPCFASPTTVVVDTTACTISTNGAVNVALAVASDGICGSNGCFVPLDANSAFGWQPVSGQTGTLQLPQALCGPTGKIASGDVLAVVTSPVTTSCALKGESLPTCGPWSSAGASTPAQPATTPIALVTGQNHPASLAVDVTNVYWTNSGTAASSTGPAVTPTGALRGIPIPGGKAVDLATAQAGARDITLALGPGGNASSFYWTTAGINPPQATNADGQVWSMAAGGKAVALASNQAGPQGIALHGGNVFWTAFGVYELPLGGTLQTTLDPAPAAGAAEYYPTRIAVDDTFAFWTNEGTLAGMNGSLSMALLADPTPIAIATGASNPRGIALDLGTTGNAVALYYTNFEAQGSVVMIPIVGGAAGAAVTVAKGLGYPDGITLDASTVYWTNRGDGTVNSLPKGSSGTPAPLASGQNNPGAIVVDGTNIYWINEGDPNLADGALMRLVKP